jgi:hypothetical protein
MSAHQLVIAVLQHQFEPSLVLPQPAQHDVKWVPGRNGRIAVLNVDLAINIVHVILHTVDTVNVIGIGKNNLAITVLAQFLASTPTSPNGHLAQQLVFRLAPLIPTINIVPNIVFKVIVLLM